MAKDTKLHLVAYGYRRKGLQFEDILNELERGFGAEAPSKAVLHRWASRESSCSCPWHDWAVLLENDSDINHSRAASLFSAGHDVVTIASTLKVSVDIVEAWGSKDYPCYCGSHGWLNIGLPEIVSSPKENFVAIPSSGSISEASQSAILTVLDAAANAIRRGDVVPRSWKDVLDTLKIVDQILNSPINGSSSTSTSTRTPGGMRLTESRSITIPPSEPGSTYLKDRSQKLANELMTAVGIETE